MSRTTATSPDLAWVRPLETCRRSDTGIVGGKNASLGEMISALAPHGIAVPPGFATTAEAFRTFMAQTGLDALVHETLDGTHTNGAALREAIVKEELPRELRAEIVAAYRRLGEQTWQSDPSVAVRSSATAEDLPDASFAGQQETFLNVRGPEALLDACRRCFASLFTDRAIAYRQAKGFAHDAVALSVGVQLMVRSDKGGSGVMFTIDPETGFPKVAVINAAWGLGETVVQGSVDPDEYAVYKPLIHKAAPVIEAKLGRKDRKMIYGAEGTTTVPTSKRERGTRVLNDAAVLRLSRWGMAIEEHYGCPMDIEWALDGVSGDLFVVQARPETIHSQQAAGANLRTYEVEGEGATLVTGASIGTAAVAGRVCLIESADDINDFEDGAILVTGETDPDWVPIMKRAAGLVTDHGGRTSHAAIVSRELGLPAIVGTGEATQVLHTGQDVTLSCAGGDEGIVTEGHADIQAVDISLDELPETRTKVMLNLANPAAAHRWWRLPADGVGLARMEFVIEHAIGVHPLALSRFDTLPDDAEKTVIAKLIDGYDDPTEFFVERLARGLGKLAALVHPRPIVVRMSDFKTNEYASLLGGASFEPEERNPMIGFRGASRYYSDAYRDGFALECRAVRRLREEMGFTNVAMMIPFCRTVGEADAVLEVMRDEGLERGRNGLHVLVMCELPSNVAAIAAFAERFDGFSIGSNDLTQLVLGIDRDSDVLRHLFDERDPAVAATIEAAIRGAHAARSTVGLCGQAPSDHPDFAEFLVRCGIDSISVSPDSFVAVKRHVAAAEAGHALAA